MHEDYMVMFKNYNKKYNQLENTFYDLQQQYDKTQFELKCVKKILLEICAEISPEKEAIVQEMLDKHDKIYRTLHEKGNLPLANIRFSYQLKPDLGDVYVWENF